MAYGDNKKPKRTFGQKVKRFLGKLTLTAAFAAAVGGTGYYHYGTQEDIRAIITDVEITPANENGEGARAIIHTNQGTFVNHPTVMFMKDGDQTAAINEALQPGKTVDIKVYGYNPNILGFTRDDLHFYRNILSASTALELLTPPSSAQPSTYYPNAQGQRTAPFERAVPPTTPDPALLAAGPAQDQLAAETSAPNDDLRAIAANTPQLAHDLAVMAQLPLTGQGIYNALKDPANNISSTLFPVARGEGSRSTYFNQIARIARGSGTSTAFHEYFHAWQDLNESRNTIFSLTMKDAVIGNLLQEASAVAYEIASQREATNHGLSFTPVNSYVERVPDGTITHTITSPSRDAANIAVFNAAYDRAWAANANASASAREEAALEAGGKAVVMRLLSNADNSWSSTYTELAVENINKNAHVFREDGTGRSYGDKRDDVFSRLGALSRTLNFIPDEFLGANAQAQIDNTFKGMGFSFVTSASNQQQTTPARQASRPQGPG